MVRRCASQNSIRQVSDAGNDPMKYVYILLALIYALSPYDLLPDFLAGWGWLDDLVVLGLMVRFLYLQQQKWQRTAAGHTQGETSQGQAQRNSGADHKTDRFQSDDPYTVLGVDRTATREHVKKAYRELVNRYHPDKVAHLGEEFRTLAEERFKQIQGAYQRIRQMRG